MFWNTLPLNRALIVIPACDRVQCWGGPIEGLRPGEVVWFAPGEKHWRGASPSMATQEQLDGKPVDWVVAVTDETVRRLNPLLTRRRCRPWLMPKRGCIEPPQAYTVAVQNTQEI